MRYSTSLGQETKPHGAHPVHTVLVVDDDSTLRGALSSWVRELGYEVRQADSAVNALDALADAPADVALCDVQMPGEDGVWLASRIRDRYPSTAIIMATGFHDIDVAVTSLRSNIVDYLLKPFGRARLIEALRLGVDWHRASKANEELQDSLEHRLRGRRAEVAAALASAQSSVDEALAGLISMLELHEHDGREHAARVSRLAAALGEELGINGEALLDVERGALLHDIGKLDMPAAILYKPAPLDETEWEVIRRHPQVGHDLLKRVPGLDGVAQIVLASHEAFDGSGYPRGLKGEDIPIGSRILAVSDSFDSMTRPHTQRPAMVPLHAIEEIQRCSGRQFDPRITAALGRVLCSLARHDGRFAAPVRK